MELSNNRKVQEYISKVCSQVHFKEIHQEIGLEIQSHIMELVDEYLSEGLSEDDAINKAITQMGDAITIGNQLNKIHKSKPEWSIVVLTTVLAIFGMVVNYFISAQGITNYNTSSILIKNMVVSILGISVGFGLYFIDYKKIKPYSKYIYILTSIFMLISILYGSVLNGASVLSIGLVRIPVQICPLLFVIALAGIMDDWNLNKPKNILYLLLLLIFPIILMAQVPSLDSIMVYSAAIVVLSIISGAKLSHILSIVGSGVCILLLQIFTKHYRLQRILAFINPNKDPYDFGYLNIQLSKLVHSAGLFGQGFTIDHRSVPSLNTDFIFAYIIYTFGWTAGILLIALFVCLIVRMAEVIGVVKNSYGKFLTSGFLTLIAVQFLWNILMVLGFAPIGGVSLPFISYGGSQFVINMIMVGIILSIYRRRNIKGITF